VPADHADAHLARRYGTEAAEVKALIALDASLAEPLVPGLSYLRAEAIHAVRREMATTLADVLTRRTRAHLRDRAACHAAAADVAELLAPELGWDAAETARQVTDYRAMCDAEVAAAAATAGSSA
jgi:glycerol-3-phosphate dehydrogenase